MADLTLPEVITRFRGNEARIADFANGNAAGYYITVDGKKVETLPSVVSRLAAAIAAASATRNDLAATGGAKLIGYGATTVDAALAAQAKGIADNAKAINDLDTAKLAKGGGTMTGALTLAGAPTEALHAVPKGWADGTYWKPGIGDVLATMRGAPDASWIPDNATYLQASYPSLFARVGTINYDSTASGFTKPGYSFNATGGICLLGMGGVFLTTDRDPNNSQQYLLRSTDNGASFKQTTPPYTLINCGATDGAGVWILGCSGGRVLRSVDNAQTWTVIDTGGQNDFNAIATDKLGRWIAPTTGNFMMRSTDNGLTWTKVLNPNSNAGACIAANGKGTWVIGSTGGGHYFSTDNGTTWAVNVLQVGAWTTNVWSDVAYGGPGVFVMVGYMNTNSGWYAAAAYSADGVTWKTSTLQNGTASSSWRVAIGKDGTTIMAGYTQGMSRTIVSLDASGQPAWTAFSGGGAGQYPLTIATDGVGTWMSTASSDKFLWRSVPTYDIKTQFYVPKAAAQPAPYANFIKAK